jgi:aminopeptidase YwaD
MLLPRLRRSAVALALGALSSCTTAAAVVQFPAPIPATDSARYALASLDVIDLVTGSGERAEHHRCVYAHYTGWLTDGTKFDSSRDTTALGTLREPLAIPLGFRRVITGWDVGFDGMQVGGQRRLIIPHQFAYGPRGRPPVIPPAATLVFDVELMAVRDTLPRVPGTAFPQCAPWGVVNGQSPTQALHAQVLPRFSGDSALATVAYLDQYVRWPGNRGFDASIAHIVERLERAGYVREGTANAGRMTYRVEQYPMTQPAWEPLDASVNIEGDSAPVLRFATNRNMLATNSYATPSEGVRAELVDAGKGTAAELDAANVRGKIVMAEMGAGRLFTEAVVRRGAVGVLGYALPAYLQPERNRTSIQFGSVPRDTTARAWGIALSFDARERLRAALARGRAAGAPTMLTVRTDVRWTPNAVEQAVVAEVRGSTHPDERFVFSAHVQEPGANDNASGVGAQVEMARVAAELVRSGEVSPARTITFLWGLEIRSTDRYIRQDSTRAAGIKWGLSLDMVGEDTEKTGGTFLIEKMPDPSAIWTRGEDRHSEWGGSPITKAQLMPHYFNDFTIGRAREQAATNGWVVGTNPFEGGSDHTPFLSAKKPGLLFWHFTDQFYHTDGDRLDKVSPRELRNVGITALVSALALTTADGPMVRGLIREVQAAATERLATEARLSTGVIRRGGAKVTELDILSTWAEYYDASLLAFTDLEVGGTSAATREAIEAARAAVRAVHARLLATLP